MDSLVEDTIWGSVMFVLIGLFLMGGGVFN